MKSKRDKRNYIIIGLCMILVVMGAGYAAFSSLLTINGTAGISNSWCVGFDNTKTNTYTPKAGITGATAPTGSMSYSGTTCESTLQPASSLTAHFYQPGDEIEYTLTIVNKSSVTAAIKSFTINGEENITTNWTNTDGNITYKVNMPSDTTLSPNESTTMTVIARFQNETDITENVNGETKTLSISIDVQQDDGSGGFTPAREPYSGDVYAWNTTSVTIGTSRINDLVSTKTAQPYYTSAVDVMSASGYPYFNKYTIVNDIISEGYTCQTFGIQGFEPVCIKYSSDGSSYGSDTTGNKGLLKSISTNETFIGDYPQGYCQSNDIRGWYCIKETLTHDHSLWLEANPEGSTRASDDSLGSECFIHSSYGTFCYD